MNLKPYPEYKDSGVEWLGKIPEHWELRRLKYCSEVIMGQSPPGENYNIDGNGLPFLQGCAEFGQNYPKPKQYCPLANKTCPSGSILLSVRAPVGRINVADQIYGIGRGLCAIVPYSEVFSSNFAVYGLQMYRIGLAFESTGSTYDAVTIGKVENLLVYLPRVSEQYQITRFLDVKTRLIDRYIRNKRRLIKLLQEQKQAIINDCVTGKMEVKNIVDENGNTSFRLQPYTEYKDSGVEWLGKIPAHWRAIRLKFICKEPLKYGANEVSGYLDANQPRFVRITDIDENGNLRNDTICTITKEKAEEFLLTEGDILFARSGATVGKTFIYKKDWGEAAFAGYLIRARINPNIVIAQYIYMFTRSGIYLSWKNSIFIQATIQNISAEKYSSLFIPIPLLAEQECIIKWISDKNHEIDNAISKAQRQIDLIREYRIRLIADVVTGKVDVRDIPVEDIPEDGTLEELEDEQEELEELPDIEENGDGDD